MEIGEQIVREYVRELEKFWPSISFTYQYIEEYSQYQIIVGDTLLFNSDIFKCQEADIYEDWNKQDIYADLTFSYGTTRLDK